MRKPVQAVKSIPGEAPGIEHDEITNLPAGGEPACITCIDYSPTYINSQEIINLDDFLSHHRPEWSSVRWINVDGLSDMQTIHTLATKYDLHPLAIEDMLHITQRPKIESYGGEETEMLARLFIVLRNPYIQDGKLHHNQVSIFLGHKTVLTFRETGSRETGSRETGSRETGSDVWDPVTQRLKSKGSRLRASDASFLAYSLLDAIIDRCFPILEFFGERAEELETQILDNSKKGTINDIHQFKRDLLLLRWAIWPMREVVSSLRRDEYETISANTNVYLGDLYDHIVQIIDIIETYREMA